MIKTIFTSTKGFHMASPGKSSPHDAVALTTKLVTNGFDQLQWERSDGSEDNDRDDLKINGENKDEYYHTGAGDHEELKEEEFSDDDDYDDDETDGDSPDLNVEDGGIYESHSSKLSYVSDLSYSLSTLSTQVSSGDHHKAANEKQNSITSNEDAPLEDSDGKLKEKAFKGKKKEGRSKKMNKDDIKAARKLKKQFKLEKRQKKNQNKGSGKHNKDSAIPDSGFDAKVELLEKLYRLASESDDDKVLKFYDITVYHEDLRNLRNDEWLNDNNIAFIYEYLTRFQIVPTLKRRTKYLSDEMIDESIIMLLPTFTFLLAHHPDPSELKGVLPKIENASFVFMPVNDNEDLETAEGGSHWSLLVISIKDRKAIIYDSMIFANEKESLGVVTKLEKYLGYKLQVLTDKSTPQQINGSDCGILVLANSCLLLSRILNAEENTFLNLNMKNMFVSAIDARIFVMGTIFNLIKDRASANI